MQTIRAALENLDLADLSLWMDDDLPRLRVTRGGELRILDSDARPRTVAGQYELEDVIDLFAPYQRGPDLRNPKPLLRIVPGKLSGEPHLQRSRIRSIEIAALARRGFSPRAIADMYGRKDVEPIHQAIELEQELGTLPLAA
jgi:uncharacterized protein (DUF433 family)